MKKEVEVKGIMVANRVELHDGLRECLEREKWTVGWFFLPGGRPARFDWFVTSTYDPTREETELRTELCL